jgi:hypothetical protein
MTYDIPFCQLFEIAMDRKYFTYYQVKGGDLQEMQLIIIERTHFALNTLLDDNQSFLT